MLLTSYISGLEPLIYKIRNKVLNCVKTLWKPKEDHYFCLTLMEH